MSDKTERQAERMAADLLEEYLLEHQQGRQPLLEEYLKRCPVAGQPILTEAVHGADLYLRYFHSAYVRPQILEKTLKGLEAIRRNKAWMAEISERAAQGWDLDITEPTASLAAFINIQTGHSQNNVLGMSASPLILNRGGGQGVSRGVMDRAWRRMQEQRLTQVVNELLEKLDIDRPPVDLAQITRRLYLFVQEVDLGDTEGCLVTDGQVGGILLNRNTGNSRRRRFTWAHEIGHFLLHRNMVAFRDTQQEIWDNPSAPHEIEANIFASLLLLPPSMLSSDLGKTKPTLQQADKLVAEFDVSLEAAIRRIIGLSHWRCALVISRDGRTERSIPSPLFESYIPPRQQLHPDTVAYSLTKVGEEETSLLWADAWVQGKLVEEGVEIQEQSRRLSDGYVYSLLTVRDPD